MNGLRLLLYVVVLLAVALAGYGLVVWALTACAPPPLPGDELWTWRQTFAEALALIARVGTRTCFTGNAEAAAGLWLGARTAGVLFVLLAAMILWESAGRHLRRVWYRTRGGHAVLAGEAEDIARLARAQRGGVAYLAPPGSALNEIARVHPFAEITPITRTLPRAVVGLGAPAARLVAAATRNDLVNVGIAEAVLDRPGTGEVLLRLEQSAVRTLSAQRLRRRADAAGRPLAIVSLTSLQTRRGLAAAMPGRFTLDGPPRVHVALCGSGEGLQGVALEVLRTGLGLERERPLISIIRTGSADFSAGVLERLAANETAELHVSTTAAGSASGLDRAIAETTARHPPPVAIHCTGATPAEAEAVALRWEEVLVALNLPVPPIVAYGSDDRPLGTTGMIRVAAAPDLSQARDLAHLMDARARAVHELFLTAQRAARGEKFGTAPAEAAWEHLSEDMREDNRAVADHMAIKLASLFMLSTPGGEGAVLAPDDVEALAPLAHARWWASKALGDWRHGAVRDDARRLHPDMIAYDDLSDPVKQKDRDEVASLPRMAALADEGLRRERRILVAGQLDGVAWSSFRATLAATPKDRVPVAVIAMDGTQSEAMAARLQAHDVLVEAVLDAATDRGAAAVAAVLRRAWRIHVAIGRSAADAALTRAGEAVDANGAVHARD